jgi:hypothetical protein
MMNLSRTQRSWLLFKASVRVITERKPLLVFPVVIFALTALLVGIFLLPVLFQPTGHPYATGEHWETVWGRLFSDRSSSPGQHEFEVRGVGILYFVALYVATMFSATFLNVAFYHEILQALQGGTVSISRGLRFACSRIGSIIMWTLLAASVGLLLKALEQRLEWAGRLVARLLGLAWSVAAVFAIPVLVIEEASLNPFLVLRRSAESLRRTWGESLIGYVGLSFGGTIAGLATLAAIASAGVLGFLLQSVWLFVSLAAGWLLLLMVFSYVMGIAGHVYRGALYLYASRGLIVEPYNRELLDMAWRSKAR